LCDDAEGMDAGREVALSVTENKFGYSRPKGEETPKEAPTAEIPPEGIEETGLGNAGQKKQPVGGVA